MNVRKAFLALSIAAAALPAAYAATGATNPVLHDGTVLLRGEAGYVSARDGFVNNAEVQRQLTHTMGINAREARAVAPGIDPRQSRAAAPMSEAQLRDYRLQYIN